MIICDILFNDFVKLCNRLSEEEMIGIIGSQALKEVNQK